MFTHVNYGDPANRVHLPFRCDEDAIARIAEQRHALNVLREAVDLCQDQDMRTTEVYAALNYLASLTKKPTAIHCYTRSLAVEHPEQREEALRFYLKEIVRVVNG